MDIDRVKRYITYLEKLDIDPSNFDITNNLVCEVFFKYIYPETKIKYFSNTNNQFNKHVTKQLNFTRLTLLNVKYYLNGNMAKGIKEGFVYIVTNPNFPNHIKVGSTVNVNDRLKQYQTYSPFRDYNLESYYFSYNRLKTERELISKFGGKYGNEWVLKDRKIFELFRVKRNYSKQIDFSKWV